MSEDLIADGDRLRDAGLYVEALARYECAVLIPDAAALAWFKKGTVYQRTGALEQAADSYQQALVLRPGYADAIVNLGLLRYAQGQTGEAEGLYRQVLADTPDNYEAMVNLGNLLLDTGRFHEALFYFRRTGVIRPGSSQPLDRQGAALRALGRTREAISLFEQALELSPGMHIAWNNLGTCYFELGEHALADSAFARSLEITKDQSWAWQNWLMLSNFHSLDREHVFSRHREWGEHVRAAFSGEVLTPPQHRRAAGTPLRVGFVSGDFRRHSVAYFINPLLQKLDRRRFEPVAFFTHRLRDDVTEQLQPLFAQWFDVVSLDDRAAAQCVVDARIDILIDLSGHTAHNRLGIFIFRPAPVQMTWLGYPNTTGMREIDYRITDALADPEPEGDTYATERLVRLPRPFLCYSPPAESPAVEPPPCLANGYITFGSFNVRVKIGKECIKLWARVLLAIPQSRLLIKSVRGLDEPDSGKALQQLFSLHGIDPDRVDVIPAQDGVREHLSTYHKVDVALDTFPYQGTTTSCEALWMGVPVLALRGDRHASRVAASLLGAINRPEWLADREDDYVQLACAIASDTGRLAKWRREQRAVMESSLLLDANSMAASFMAVLDSVATDAGIETVPVPPQQLPKGIRIAIGVAPTQDGIDGWQVWAGDDFQEWLDQLPAGCAEIYICHRLQRVGLPHVSEVMARLHSALLPGGRLLISVPDMAVLSSLFGREDMSGQERFMLMRILFGGQSVARDSNRIGLNFEFMTDYAALAGFSSIEQVDSFGLFDDASSGMVRDVSISLNLVLEK